MADATLRGRTEPALGSNSRAGAAPLPAGFYDRPVLEVARDLVGCVVRYGDGAGVIVETEAYHEVEPACHAYAGFKPHTAVLFGPPGDAYVYRSYGVHALLNAVCEEEGTGAAVLIRALEPFEGLDAMRARRGLERAEDLCSGPGKLTQALGLWLDNNGTSLQDGPVRIEPRRDAREPPISVGPRIGITHAVELPWRFCLSASRHISRPLPPGLAAARRAALARA
jgi:DNA-3-methyladenine glycosylase